MTNKLGDRNQSISPLNICQRWLELVALLHIIGGLSLSFNWPSAIWFEYRSELFQVFDISQKVNADVNLIVMMLTQLFGPTIASWGILMFYLVRQLTATKKVKDTKFSIGDKQIYCQKNSSANILILATLLWFVLDTSISLRFDMSLHLTINLLAALSILLPLVYLRLNKGV